MKTFICVLILTVLSIADAGDLVVDVPGLKGNYEPGQVQTRTAAAVFDPEALPKGIAGVSLRLKGYISPGLARTVSGNTYINFWPRITGETNLLSTCKYRGQDAYERAYIDIELPLQPGVSGCGYDFLLDGQETVKLDVSGGILLAIYTVIYGPEANITSAKLVIKDALSIVRPGGGEFIDAGSNYTIIWNDTRQSGAGGYLLEFSQDKGGTWDQIGQAGAAERSFKWSVPVLDSNACMVRVSDILTSDVSETSQSFTVYQCKHVISGDLNHDCYVNYKDYAVLAANWLNQCDAVSWCQGADMNFSNAVNAADMKFLGDEWLKCANEVDTRCEN